jgi:hypothetical protein
MRCGRLRILSGPCHDARTMTPQEFINKWGPGGPSYALNERQGAQLHFIDLCKLLDVPTPDDSDNYCFEQGVLKLSGSKTGQRGFADVWKRDAFAWEYKAPGRNLDDALRQLLPYAAALHNPPLLIVSDRLTTRISTHFTGTPTETHTVELADLADPARRELLRRVVLAPDTFRPKRTNRDITEAAAKAFATTAENLRNTGHAPDLVAHFLTQCMFCFFAEDVGLLPARLFERLVGNKIDPAQLRRGLTELFSKMRDGGLFGAESIAWFNGGLFKTVDVPALRNAAALSSVALFK